MSYHALNIDEAREQAPGWSVDADRPALVRRFVFSDFAAAFAFMTRCAAMAERIDHHPEWRNVYNVVEVVLTTHATGGLSDRDVTMAQFMTRAALEMGAKS